MWHIPPFLQIYFSFGAHLSIRCRKSLIKLLFTSIIGKNIVQFNETLLYERHSYLTLQAVMLVCTCAICLTGVVNFAATSVLTQVLSIWGTFVWIKIDDKLYISLEKKLCFLYRSTDILLQTIQQRVTVFAKLSVKFLRAFATKIVFINHNATTSICTHILTMQRANVYGREW